VVVQDESIFTWEVKLKKLWAKQGSKLRKKITGSKAKTCVFGAISENGQQLFRQFPKCNSEYFIPYLKELITRFGKMLLYLDRASWHKTSKTVKDFLETHKDKIIVIWFPPGWPELNPVEECWRQGKNDDDLGAKFYSKFAEFKKAITAYYRTKRFKLDVYNYLCL